MPRVTSGSTIHQSNRMISVPATMTATEPSASDRLCTKAARMFTLLFDSAHVSPAVTRSTASATPATTTTTQPVTGTGSTKRVTASNTR